AKAPARGPVDLGRRRPPAHGRARHLRRLRPDRGAASGRLHRGHLQPGADRVAGPDGRRLAGPVRDRPAAVGRLRAGARRRVLSQAPKARPRRRLDDAAPPPTPAADAMTTIYRTIVLDLPPTPLGLLPRRWAIQHHCTV